MLVLGLTGGIGMGKSFVTDALRALDVPVLDSDASVHALYAPGGGAVAAVRGAFGDEVIGPDGGVDRAALSKKVLGDTETHTKNMKTLESLVHPLVDSKRDAFLKQANLDKHAFVVLDIPLLFEKKYETTVDGVLVVSAGEEKQRERCLAARRHDGDETEKHRRETNPRRREDRKGGCRHRHGVLQGRDSETGRGVGDVDTRRPGGVPGENLHFERSGGVTRA
jgi:dephospho-CoA kinase